MEHFVKQPRQLLAAALVLGAVACHSELALAQTYDAFKQFSIKDNPSETWAGRGLRPRWLAAALKAGHKIEEFLIGGASKPAAAKASKNKRGRKAAARKSSKPPKAAKRRKAKAARAPAPRRKAAAPNVAAQPEASA